jgi:DNA gyrase/topoisomerase IV subunit A
MINLNRENEMQQYDYEKGKKEEMKNQQNEIENGFINKEKPTNEEIGAMKNGNGKKMLPSEIVTQKRGGKGLKCYKGTDPIVAAALVSDEDKVLVVGNRSSICINAAEIPALGRSSIGNVMLKGNMVLSVSKV